jgi:hypothetical protein
VGVGLQCGRGHPAGGVRVYVCIQGACRRMRVGIQRVRRRAGTCRHPVCECVGVGREGEGEGESKDKSH